MQQPTGGRVEKGEDRTSGRATAAAAPGAPLACAMAARFMLRLEGESPSDDSTAAAAAAARMDPKRLLPAPLCTARRRAGEQVMSQCTAPERQRWESESSPRV
jgi:hypothetical protein